jgi:hypothetical protein
LSCHSAPRAGSPGGDVGHRRAVVRFYSAERCGRKGGGRVAHTCASTQPLRTKLRSHYTSGGVVAIATDSGQLPRVRGVCVLPP